MARSGVVSSTSTTARSVENEWRSSALAGMTSTPPGKRARSCSSAPGRSAVELVPGHQLLDAVRLLLLLEPVRVGVVLDLGLLFVVERARRILLEDLVPDRVGAIAVLDRAEPDVEDEDLVLEVDLREHPARVPPELAAHVLGGGVLRDEPRDLRELRSPFELLLDVRDLLQLFAVCLEVGARGREWRRDLDPSDAHLLRRRLPAALLRAPGVLLAQQLVARARSDLLRRYPIGERTLDELVLFRSALLDHLQDVVAELALHRIGDLAKRHRLRGFLELLHELSLADPAKV